jgi:hypothetical protein
MSSCDFSSALLCAAPEQRRDASSAFPAQVVSA